MVFTARMCGGCGRRCASFCGLIYDLSRAPADAYVRSSRARRPRPRQAEIKSGFKGARGGLRKDLSGVSFRGKKPVGRNRCVSGQSGARSTPLTRKGTQALLRRPTEQVVQQNGPRHPNVERVHARVIRGRADLDQRVARAPHGRPQALALTANHQDRRLCRIQT